MKTSLGTQNKSRSTKQAPSVPPTTSPGAQNMKTDQAPSLLPKMSSGAENIKSGLTPSVQSKMSPGAQTIKTGLDTLETTENEFRSAIHEN
jgi:hypothetical protein